MKTLKFKWTTSRGRDTYGYNICSLWIDGKKVSSCMGGGYDMKGTALAEWMTSEFEDRLKKLNSSSFYGLGFYNRKRHKYQKTYSKDCRIYLDGACGFSSMEKILNRLGYKLQFVDSGRNHTTYVLD